LGKGVICSNRSEAQEVFSVSVNNFARRPSAPAIGQIGVVRIPRVGAVSGTLGCWGWDFESFLICSRHSCSVGAGSLFQYAAREN
jgi:hypothetical protein